MPKITHSGLIKIARKWLVKARRCGVVLSEVADPLTGETPDVIGWRGRHSILIECKTSKADFRRDMKKWFRVGSPGLGQRRYFMAPVGIVPADEVPNGWGLLEVDGAVVKTVLEEDLLFHDEKRAAAELPLLVAALRRTQLKLKSRRRRRTRKTRGRIESS